MSLEQWRARQQQDAPHEQRLARIDRHIAELQLLQGEASAQAFLERLARAEAEQRPERRNLLLDSLVLDLAQAAREHQQQRQRLEHLQDLASEVAALGAAEHAELLQRAAACQPDSDPQQLAELTERCNAILTAHLQQQAALARRQAVLQGLASLGYEVREGMATAWAQTGRVVLRKPATPGYGLESVARPTTAACNCAPSPSTPTATASATATSKPSGAANSNASRPARRPGRRTQRGTRAGSGRSGVEGDWRGGAAGDGVARQRGCEGAGWRLGEAFDPGSPSLDPWMPLATLPARC